MNRNKFIELLDKQLDIFNIKDELFQAIHNKPTRQTLENIDNNILYVLEVVRKEIEDLKRSILFSKTKEKQRATILYWKGRLKKAKAKSIDENTLEK